jgi:tartrate/fumarate subfamily iron-sulfur-dependent hydro-lyase beta chain
MEHHLRTPVPPCTIKTVRMGDVIFLTGTVITARDEAHRKALKYHREGRDLPVDFRGIGVFHCGPIMKKVGGEWTVVAAGPTTSARMEVFQDEFIEVFRPAIIIGKGGMGDRTARACQEFNCVYGALTGGAALLASRGIKEVRDVFWLDELGMPECLWVFHVEELGPMIVTIDNHGNNLTKNVNEEVSGRLTRILTEMSE